MRKNIRIKSFVTLLLLDKPSNSIDSIEFDFRRHSALPTKGFERLFTILLQFTQVANVHKFCSCSQTLNTLPSKKIESGDIERKDKRTQSPKIAFERKFVGVVEYEFRKMVSSS